MSLTLSVMHPSFVGSFTFAIKADVCLSRNQVQYPIGSGPVGEG
jgi:hypothetical protein